MMDVSKWRVVVGGGVIMKLCLDLVRVKMR